MKNKNLDLISELTWELFDKTSKEEGTIAILFDLFENSKHTLDDYYVEQLDFFFDAISLFDKDIDEMTDLLQFRELHKAFLTLRQHGLDDEFNLLNFFNDSVRHELIPPEIDIKKLYSIDVTDTAVLSHLENIKTIAYSVLMMYKKHGDALDYLIKNGADRFAQTANEAELIRAFDISGRKVEVLFVSLDV